MAKLIVKSPYIKCTGIGGAAGAGGYMRYIATHPRAERLGTHGLFIDADSVDLSKSMAELEASSGNVAPLSRQTPVRRSCRTYCFYKNVTVRS